MAKKDSPEIKPHIKYIDCGSSFVYLIDGNIFFQILSIISFFFIDTNDLWFFGEGNFHNLGDSKIFLRRKRIFIVK